MNVIDKDGAVWYVEKEKYGCGWKWKRIGWKGMSGGEGQCDFCWRELGR